MPLLSLFFMPFPRLHVPLGPLSGRCTALAGTATCTFALELLRPPPPLCPGVCPTPQTFSEGQAGVLLKSPQRREELAAADVAAFVFDGQYPDTFRTAASPCQLARS